MFSLIHVKFKVKTLALFKKYLYSWVHKHTRRGEGGGGLSILAEIAIRSKVRIKDKYAFIILIVTFRDECAGQP